MTTNVYDGASRTMVTDSRWSIQYGQFLMYVDDMQCDKIERYADAAFMFAGRGLSVQAWKDWIRTNPVNNIDQPVVEGISVCIVNTRSGDVLFQERQDIIKEGACFAGSGARHAFLCWDKNRDPRRSVTTAAGIDPCTGGEVKFFEMVSGSHNLAYPVRNVTIQMVTKAIETRGNVMTIEPNGNVAPFKRMDAAANDEALSEVKAKIASGELSPEAPCDSMYGEWTSEEKQRLNKALGAVFGWTTP